MGGETDASERTPRESAPRRSTGPVAAWRVLPVVLVSALLLYSHWRGQDPEVREKKAMQRGDAELLQTLRSGGDAYSLVYFGYVVVYKNGKRVFDSSETETQGCIRLRRRDDGVVELECQHVDRLDAIFFPMP
jgi:hypothetical protein